MKKLLLTFVLLAQGSALAQAPIPLEEAVRDFPRSLLQPRTNGPVSIEINQGERAGYETLAEIAGLNIIFDPDFRNRLTAPFRIENTGIFQAFDLLSMSSGAFVEVLDSKTIIVSPDNPTKRRQHELQVLKTFYLTNTPRQGLTDIITALRTTLQLRYIAQSTTASAIVLRDTPNQIALAEKMIASSAQITAGPAVATNGVGHLFTLEAGAVQESAPSRSALQPKSTGTFSFKTSEDSRTIFEMLARTAGLNIIFDRDFRSVATAFKVENVGILDALDLLALQTGTFWEVLDGKTIMVSPDNQIKRRDFENQIIKTFYLSNTSPVELIEIVTGLRTLLNCRYLAIVGATNAIVIRENPNRMALAERLIADLRSPGGVVAASGIPSGTEVGFVRNRRAAGTLTAAQSQLLPRVRGPFSFDMKNGVRASYEAMAGMAGLRVSFDNRFQDAAAAPFKLESVGVLDALDFLSLQTGNIWQAVDSDTIIVAPDNPTVRGDLVVRTTKTINLSNVQQQGMTEIVTALRTLLNLRQVAVLGNSIVVQDTAENIVFAEKIVADLDRPGGR